MHRLLWKAEHRQNHGLLTIIFCKDLLLMSIWKVLNVQTFLLGVPKLPHCNFFIWAGWIKKLTGHIWDVVCLHLLYTNLPPSLQLLHCASSVFLGFFVRYKSVESLAAKPSDSHHHTTLLKPCTSTAFTTCHGSSSVLWYKSLVPVLHSLTLLTSSHPPSLPPSTSSPLPPPIFPPSLLSNDTVPHRGLMG